MREYGILAHMSKTDILGTREVCQALQVSRATVQRLTRAGVLNPQKLPGRTGALVFDPREVDALRSARVRRIGGSE